MSDEVEVHHWETNAHSLSPGIYAMLATVGDFRVWLYVGMTTVRIANRIASHRDPDSNIGPVLNAMSTEGWDILIYEVPIARERDESDQEFSDRLRAMERCGIDELDPLLNANPGRTAHRELLIRLMCVSAPDRRRRPNFKSAEAVARVFNVCEYDVWQMVRTRALAEPREINGRPWWTTRDIDKAREVVGNNR